MVAIGEAAPEISGVFARICAVVRADVDGGRGRSPPPIRRAAAMPWCCRRRAPASTGTRTAATRHVATTSGGWSPNRRRSKGGPMTRPSTRAERRLAPNELRSTLRRVIAERRRRRSSGCSVAPAVASGPTRARQPTTSAVALGPPPGRVLRDRRRRHRVRHARSGDGALGVVDHHSARATRRGGSSTGSCCGPASASSAVVAVKVPYHRWRRFIVPFAILAAAGDAAAVRAAARAPRSTMPTRG